MTTTAADPAAYATFRILVDEPATKDPLLSFDAYARAFAEMIEESPAQFAIGIFGTWGSGKTTLMGAIREELRHRPQIVPVWFNAWRYEREDHLIVPMLDTLRDSLNNYASSQSADPTMKQRATEAASAMGRAAVAISRGLKLRLGIPFTNIGLDADIEAIHKALTEKPPDGPMSFYYGAFSQMEKAVKDFGADGERRIVVFIDDLDRCLPASALSVLESMKLFFDFEGFVFVVGLDQEVVQRAIDDKYRITDDRVVLMPGAPSAPAGAGPTEPVPAGGAGPAPVANGGFSGPTPERHVQKLGAEYVKKIFQVPFSLPRISTTDLEGFFQDLLRTSGVPEAQENDLQAQVQPHVGHLSGGGAVNPREVKRLINAYTLQMKLLSARRLDNLKPNAVVTILTMSFRADWRSLYDLLVADPDGFADAIRPVRDSGEEVARLWPGDQTVPRDFREYLNGPGGAILDAGPLERYVASVEASRTLITGVGDVQQSVVDLGRRIARLAETGVPVADDSEAIGTGIEVLASTVDSLPSVPAASRIQTGARQLREQLSTVSWNGTASDIRVWGRQTEPILRGMYYDLRQLRGLTDVGGKA